MKQLATAYRQTTGYSIKGSVLLGLFGFWLVLFTFPNFFYRLSVEGLPIGMAPIVEIARGVSGDLVDGSKTQFIDYLRLPLAVALPVLTWLLVGATAVRAARAKSWRPVATLGANLGLGVVAFPLFAWGVQLVLWVFGLGGSVLSWIASLQSGPLVGVVRIVGVVIFALFVSAGLIWLLVVSQRARWVVPGIGLGAGVIFLLRDPLASLLGPPWAALASGAATAGSAVAYGFGFFVLAVGALLGWVLALLLLAYLGSTMWTPLRDASRSGRQVDRFADVAAGVGVAASTLITAGVYNKDFAAFLSKAAEARLGLPGVGALPSILDVNFTSVMPSGFSDFFLMLFKGFNGAPDLLIIALACAIGVLSLAFTPGNLAAPTGKPTILTFGFMRVILAMVAVMVALIFTSFDPG